MQDRFLKILRAMVSHDDNRFCFDCHQQGPTYVNVTIGSFVCTACGGALRKYNHRVKSISMSNFSPAEMELLRKRGNKACQKIYMATGLDNTLIDYQPVDSTRDDYLRQKYQLKKWYREPTSEIETTAIQTNQKLIDCIDQNGLHARTARSTFINASSGLILSSRTSPTSGKPSLQSHSEVNGSVSLSPKSTVSDNQFVDNLFDGFRQPPSYNSTVSEQLAANIFTTTNDPFSLAAPPSGAVFSAPQPSPNLFASFQANITPPSVHPSAPLSNQPVAVQSSAHSSLSANWSMPPFESSNTSHATFVPLNEPKDKYAALAELDGLFKTTAFTNVVTTSTTDAIRTGVKYSSSSSLFTQPTSLQSTLPLFNTIPSNPFMTPATIYGAPPAQINSKNPFAEQQVLQTASFQMGAFTENRAFVSQNGPHLPVYTDHSTTSSNPFYQSAQFPVAPLFPNPSTTWLFQQSDFPSGFPPMTENSPFNGSFSTSTAPKSASNKMAFADLKPFDF